MLISQAWAQSGGGSAPGLLELFFPLLLVFAIIYFMIIRPQQKRQREHKAMIAGLKPRDKVVTQGGLIGEVRHVGDDEVKLRLNDNVEVKVVKTMIVSSKS